MRFGLLGFVPGIPKCVLECLERILGQQNAFGCAGSESLHSKMRFGVLGTNRRIAKCILELREWRYLFAHTIVRFARCGSCDKMKSVVGVLYDKTDSLKSKRDKIVAYSVLGGTA